MEIKLYWIYTPYIEYKYGETCLNWTLNKQDSCLNQTLDKFGTFPI